MTPDFKAEAERILHCVWPNSEGSENPQWPNFINELSASLLSAYQAGEAKKGEHGRLMYQKGYKEGEERVVKAAENTPAVVEARDVSRVAP